MVGSDNQTGTGASSSSHGGTMGSEEIKREAQGQAHELKDEARDTVEEVAGAARQQAENMFNSQKEAAVEQTSKLSSVFQKMADEFDNQDQSYFSGYARNMANCVDHVSQQLREKDIQSLVNDAQQYSRREPVLFMGGAIAAGFFISRFLRSSGKRSGTTDSSYDDAPQY
ncbi:MULTISPECIES: hypothetical protein [Halomonadaceae]|uniref:hypothetical protein n=1 Tax=Halomonadaceae TaxID=28256 RepID=UPI001597F5C5|nr:MULTISPECIES: hypothetical protein [Halomonas]QJQ95117.1 hypothetical protein HIO72_07415 [Halomonas sp. PA5]